mgnify:CR=1 FL=1
MSVFTLAPIPKDADMTKEEFEELLQRYKEGSCSLEEIQKVDYWFSKISSEDLELNEKERLEMEWNDNVVVSRYANTTIA